MTMNMCIERLVATRMHTDSWALTAAYGPILALSPVIGLLYWACLQLNPLAVHLQTSGPTFITSLHCDAHFCSKTQQPQERMLTPGLLQLPVHLHLALTLPTGPGSHQYIYMCLNHLQ